jgi:hypothetical protein
MKSITTSTGAREATLVRSDRLVSADRHRYRLLVGCTIERDHGRIGEHPQVPDGELAESTGADHEHATGGTAHMKQVEGVRDGAVRGEAAARERGRGDRVETVERGEVAPVLDEHPLGVAAVHHESGLGGVAADHLHPVGALVARTAPPWGVDHDGSELVMDASDLVTEHQRERAGVVAVDDVQVGVAHPAGGDGDDLALAGRLREVGVQVQRRVGSVERDGVHQ